MSLQAASRKFRPHGAPRDLARSRDSPRLGCKGRGKCNTCGYDVLKLLRVMGLGVAAGCNQARKNRADEASILSGSAAGQLSKREARVVSDNAALHTSPCARCQVVMLTLARCTLDSADGGPQFETLVTCSWLPGQHQPFICLFCS